LGIARELRRFHRDDLGSPELTTVMLVALISVPLVIAIVLFAQWAFRAWTESTGPKTGIQDRNIQGDTSSGLPGRP